MHAPPTGIESCGETCRGNANESPKRPSKSKTMIEKLQDLPAVEPDNPWEALPALLLQSGREVKTRGRVIGRLGNALSLHQNSCCKTCCEALVGTQCPMKCVRKLRRSIATSHGVCTCEFVRFSDGTKKYEFEHAHHRCNNLFVLVYHTLFVEYCRFTVKHLLIYIHIGDANSFACIKGGVTCTNLVRACCENL